MIEIDIKTINNYSSFLTRQGKNAKFIKYLPNAEPRRRLIFLVDTNELNCDEKGKCWSVNGVDSKTLETSYLGFDIFAEDRNIGWINLNNSEIPKENNVLTECSPVIYNSQEEALKNSTEKTYKTIKIEWR